MRLFSIDRTLFLALIILFSPVMVSEIYAKSIDCSICHPDLAKKKIVHAAVSMGCTGCHTNLNAAKVPHKVTGKITKGLSSDAPDLCYGCHDKAKFTKKNVHAALMMGCASCHNPHSTDTQKLLVSDMPGLCLTCHDKTKFENKVVHAALGMGCTGCHNPHSSDSAKLLNADVPDICFNCHDKAAFSRKIVHAPVMGGMCLSCHSPHATAEMALLLKQPTAVCVECHPDVLKKRHVVGDFNHPVGSVAAKDNKKPEGKKKAKREKGPLMDPARQGKEFYCGSCHHPHSSDNKGLIRYEASNVFEFCIHCHKRKSSVKELTIAPMLP